MAAGRLGFKASRSSGVDYSGVALWRAVVAEFCTGISTIDIGDYRSNGILNSKLRAGNYPSFVIDLEFPSRRSRSENPRQVAHK
jgi:hypothetical protein